MDRQKLFKIFNEFFLGRPNYFFELSETTVKTLIRQNFLPCSRQIVEKKGQKAVLRLTRKIMYKNCVFLVRTPPQSYYLLNLSWSARQKNANF